MTRKNKKSKLPQKGRPAKIDVEQILSCAFRLGLPNISMHSIAKELGVSTTALYRHISSKDELVTLCTDTISQRVLLPQTNNWEEMLYGMARSYRKEIKAVSGSVNFIRQVGLTTPSACAIADTVLRTLKQSGFSPEGASIALAGVFSHTTDMILHEEQTLKQLEQSEENATDFLNHITETFPNVAWAMKEASIHDHENNFEVGLQIIIEGLKVVFPLNN